MKKNDIKLIMIVLLIAMAGFIASRFIGNQSAEIVVITVHGKEYGRYSMKEDQEVAIGDTNVLVIQNEKVDMIQGDCPDQVCVKQKAISSNRETIVCLPNQVVVEVLTKDDTQLDGIAQ